MHQCKLPVDRRNARFGGPMFSAAGLALALAISSPTLIFAQRYSEDFDPAAPPITHRGLVIDSRGRPVSDVLVTSEAAWSETPWGARFADFPARRVVEKSTRTDQDGRFERAGLRPIVRSQGQRTLYFEHPDYGLAWRKPYSEYGLTRRHDGQILIELRQGVEFDGVVTDLEGRPIAGAWVGVRVSYSDRQDRQPRLPTSYEGIARLAEDNGRAVATDAAGRFKLPLLPVGAKPDLTVRHRDFAEFGLSVSVEDRHVEIKLKPGVTLQGRLLADGKPIEQAGVEVVAIVRGRYEFAARTKTDRHGRYKFTGLGENEYAVLTAAFTVSDKELIATPRLIEQQMPGANASADLVCSSGQVVLGRVTDGKNRPVADYFVDGSLAGFWPSFVAKTDSEGRYRMRLAPGNYQLRTRDWKKVNDTGGHANMVITRDVSVTANVAPEELDFQLEMVEIQSRLVDEGGRGISGVFYLVLRSTSGQPFPTDKNGIFWPIPAPFTRKQKVYYAVSRGKTLCRLFACSGAEEDFPEEIVLAPTAKVIGRLANIDVEGFDAWMFTVRAEEWEVRPPDGRGELFPQYVELPRDFWSLAFRPDGKFELSVPTGVRLSLAFRTEPGASARLRTETDLFLSRPLLSVDDLKPGETRDLGDVRP
ncbi:MAG TPA: carboxypeptidase-like regulatory domain-containing protein [Pirellulales bacterium]|nr:carboxypeptidase-like regulatory domain-containing protein [Pirellulales bacterium]